MKKRFTLFLLFLLVCIAGFSQGRGRTSISFTDINGDWVYPVPKVIIRNSDSASNPTNPLTMVNTDLIYSYYDSFVFDTSYLGTAFTINYYACGQWNKLDVNYVRTSNTNGAYLYFDTSLTIPCVRPCTAEFNYALNTSFNTVYHQFHSMTGPSIKHEWDLGDGRIINSSYPTVVFDSVGPITVRHVLHDTVRNCRDTAYKTINIDPHCDGGFTLTDLGGLLYELRARNSNAYSHVWIIDGDTVVAGRTYQHQFTSPGNYSIFHTSSYQNVCSHTFGTPNYPIQACQVSVSYSNQYGLVSFVPYTATKPLHYNFGDGDTGTFTGNFTHTYSQPGTYTLLVSDPSNKCNSRSYTITIPMFCTSNFTISSFKNFELFVNGPTHASFSSRYILSTGDTLFGDTATYEVNASGTYLIRRELYNQQGQLMCSNQIYYTFNQCGIGDYGYVSDLIRGAVQFNSQRSTNFGALRVYLIKHVTSSGTLTAVDSIDLSSSSNDSGYFSFTQPCDTNANYLVKAALLPSSSIYSNYMPTYFQSSFSWANAQSVNTSNFTIIDMISGTNPGGPGFIGGLISQGANKKFKPLEGIQVNLFTEQGDAVAYTHSQSDGSYAFQNIAYGKYKVTVEELGKSSDAYWVIIDANNPKSEGRNFEVNSTYVSLLSTGILKQELSTGLYPNPCNDILIIDWLNDNHDQVEMSFYGLDGKLLKTINLNKEGKTTQIDVSELPKGLYYLRIIGEKGQSSHLIQKL